MLAAVVCAVFLFLLYAVSGTDEGGAGPEAAAVLLVPAVKSLAAMVAPVPAVPCIALLSEKILQEKAH